MAFEDHYDSTKALSVYNALRIASKWREQEAFSPATLHSLLFEHWAPVDESYVASGIAFLEQRQFVVVEDGNVRMARPGARLKRADENRELEWA